MRAQVVIPVIASILILGTLGLSQDPFAQAIQGNISGTVDDVDVGTLLNGIEVSILNADNAVLAATTFTDATGFYDSGGIPDGDYKVRFSDPGVFAPGFYIPEFFGAGDVDSFDSGSTVSVVSDSTTTVDESMKFSGPSLILTATGTIFGHVSDVADSSSLGGIQVSFFNGENAVLISTTTTDVNGEYSSGVLTVFGTVKVKVRFSDPADIYLPEYSGASGTDSFSSGTFLTFSGTTHEVDETMARKVINGNVSVDPGETGLIDSATVNGNVQVNDGDLTITSGSTVTGNVDVTNGGTVTIEAGSTVQGNVNVSGAGSVLVIEDANVDGNVETQNSDPVTITRSIISGNILSTNDGTVTITDSTVSGNIDVVSPASCSESGNTVNGSISGCP